MSGDFIDSNVIIYIFDESSPIKCATAKDIVRQAISSKSGCISYQVVQETLNVICCKLQASVSRDDAERFLRKVLFPIWKIMPSEGLYQRALDIRMRYGYSFYDSLIIGAALTAGCTRLYSEDLQHGQRIESLVIENPFT